VTPLWKQAIRLARALEYANHAGNQQAAELHHAALLAILKQLMEKDNDEARRRSEKQKHQSEQVNDLLDQSTKGDDR
jgi:hypothetical protein